MSKRATHKGTCQACGRLQRLPSGSLSKHGYTVDFGFFSGTCTGAHKLPLELDRAVLDATVIDLRSWADEYEAGDRLPPVTVSVYNRNKGRSENIACSGFRDWLRKGRSRMDSRIGTRDFRNMRHADIRRNWMYAVESQSKRKAASIAGARLHAAMLVELADRVHGTELTAV